MVFFALTFSPDELPRESWYVVVLGGLMFLGLVGWLVASLKARRIRKQKLVRGLPLWLQVSLILAGMVLGVVGSMLSVGASMEGLTEQEQVRVATERGFTAVFDETGNLKISPTETSNNELRSARGSLLVWMCFGLMCIGGTVLEARPASSKPVETTLA